MPSLDVTALLTSIDLKLTKKIPELLQRHDPNNPLETSANRELTDLFTHIKFDGDIYEQTRGTPMGSPMLEFLAEVMMQALADIAPSKIQPKIRIRYVDDNFVTITHCDMENAQTIIKIFDKIQFIIEMENNNKKFLIWGYW